MNNLNDLAKEVANMEGKKVSVSIAQIKEVLRCLRDVLRKLSPKELLEVTAKLIDPDYTVPKRRRP